MKVLLFAILVLSILSAGFLLKNSLNNEKIQKSNGQNVVNADNGGTDAFIEQVKNSTGEWVDDAGAPIFDNNYVAALPPIYIEDIPYGVLGTNIAADGSEKWIEVDLSDQRLFGWEGEKKSL